MFGSDENFNGSYLDVRLKTFLSVQSNLLYNHIRILLRMFLSTGTSKNLFMVIHRRLVFMGNCFNEFNNNKIMKIAV